MKGLLVDPMTNSPNYHHKNYLRTVRRIYN